MMRKLCAILLVSLLAFSTNQADGSSFDDCHMQCSIIYDFQKQTSCGQGCDLASADSSLTDCTSVCSSSNITESCEYGCKYEVSQRDKQLQSQQQPEDQQLQQQPEDVNINKLMDQFLNSPSTQYFVRFKWILTSDDDGKVEAYQSAPSPVQYDDSYSQIFMNRFRCIRRHHLAFPFLLSLCFLLFSSVLLLIISILYRIREARRRAHKRSMEKLPQYHEVPTKLFIPNDPAFYEAGPLPEKQPIQA